MTTMGYIIGVRRTMLGMSRKELAEASGLAYVYICQLENDDKNPSLKSLTKIAGGLKFASVLHMMQWQAKLEQFLKEEAA